MKQYSSYKDSGIAWIGQIPSHWEKRKMKFCFNERVDKNHPLEVKLSATQTNGVIPQTMYEGQGNRVVNVNTGFETLKLVKIGDFVIHLRSFQGGIEYAYYQGIISPAYTILEPQSPNYSGFYKYLFKSYPYIQLLKTCVTGIREGQNIDYKILGNKYIPIPPVDEQEAIVRFITEKSEKIDRYIAEQERLLAALDELRAAEIARAVTRGLNPDVPLRDSGNVWVPQIPHHWNLITIRGVAENFFKGNGITKLDLYEDGDCICIRYADIYTKYSTAFSSVNTKTKKDILATLVYAEYGDILFTCTGESVEDIGKSVAYLGNDPLLVGGDIIVMKHSQNPKFLGYALETHSSKLQKGFGKSKLKVVHTSVGDLKNVGFALPPLSEQRAIVEYLDEKTAKIDRMKADIEKQIGLLKEYKQRMISDAVTGKIDVRE